MNSTFCKHVYLPLVEWYKQTPLSDYIEEAEENQYVPRENLRKRQFDNLAEVVHHAEEHSPYYRDLYAEHSVSASDLEAPEDLRDFPIVEKADVQENAEEMIAEEYPGNLMRGLTSGSTGESLEFFYDSHHFARMRACMWRGRRWWGTHRWEPRLILWSRPVEQELSTEWKTVLKNRLRNNYQFNTFRQLEPEYLEKIVETIESAKPSLIYGYASSLARLAEFIDAKGISINDDESLRLVEYTADHMSPAERKLASKVFRAPVISQYGASEVPAISNECPEGNHHRAVDQVFVEFLREDGTHAEPGEMAEMVVTSLYNYGMPMIRYRVGDMGVYYEEECDCGRTLPLMELRAGRSVDLIHTSERSGVTSHVLDHINMYLMRKGYEGIRQFMVEQMGRDEFELSIVKDDPFDPESVREYLRQMRSYLGEQIEVEVEYVDHIPVSSSGKRRFFRKRMSDEKTAQSSS